MADELQLVVLTKDLKKHSLKKGDIGTIVHVYKDKKSFEEEFVAASGETIAVLTLNEKQIRSMTNHEILHARGFVAV